MSLGDSLVSESLCDGFVGGSEEDEATSCGCDVHAERTVGDETGLVEQLGKHIILIVLVIAHREKMAETVAR